MELIGSCETRGYTVEAYFPERGAEDIWVIWVVKDGKVVGESTTRVEVGSVYGRDEWTLGWLERVADAAVEAVLRKEATRSTSARADSNFHRGLGHPAYILPRGSAPETETARQGATMLRLAGTQSRPITNHQKTARRSTRSPTQSRTTSASPSRRTP